MTRTIAELNCAPRAKRVRGFSGRLTPRAGKTVVQRRSGRLVSRDTGEHIGNSVFRGGNKLTHAATDTTQAPNERRWIPADEQPLSGERRWIPADEQPLRGERRCVPADEQPVTVTRKQKASNRNPKPVNSHCTSPDYRNLRLET